MIGTGDYGHHKCPNVLLFLSTLHTIHNVQRRAEALDGLRRGTAITGERGAAAGNVCHVWGHPGDQHANRTA